MNASLMSLEIAVVLTGLALLLLDLWLPVEHKRKLAHVAALAVGLILIFSFTELTDLDRPQLAFGGVYVLDALAMFFKRFFLLAAVLVLLMCAEFADRIDAGISEYYSLILFALAGMMFAASANDFTMLFV
jgi:NADH-quinone oxidoreductase subunit N